MKGIDLEGETKQKWACVTVRVRGSLPRKIVEGAIFTGADTREALQKENY